MKKIIGIISISFLLIFITSCSCFNIGGGSNNNNNKYDESNSIKNITLVVDKTKLLVNETALFNVIFDGEWFNTGNITTTEYLRLFYYSSKEGMAEDKLLATKKLSDSNVEIYSDIMEEFDVYCILAHKDYPNSSAEKNYLKSNSIKIRVTGNEIYTVEDLQNIKKIR